MSVAPSASLYGLLMCWCVLGSCSTGVGHVDDDRGDLSAGPIRVTRPVVGFVQTNLGIAAVHVHEDFRVAGRHRGPSAAAAHAAGARARCRRPR